MLPRPPISTLFPYTTLFRSVAENDQLLLLRDGQKTALEPYGKELFLLPFPEFALFPLRFHRDNGKVAELDRKSTRLNSSHTVISYAVFCLKKKIKTILQQKT